MKFLAIVMVLVPLPVLAAGWDTESPDLATWFATQVVKDCCDQKDAYLADDFASDNEGNYIAIITDGSANEYYNKPAIPNGTRIVIPKDKVKSFPPAPGHGVVFLSKTEPRYVYCYFPPGGV